MAETGLNGWSRYRYENQPVLLSPPVAQRDATDWAACCASALSRPALGLLPHQARYALARDDSLRLEFTGCSDAAPIPDHALALFGAERQTWASERLEPARMAALIQTLDEEGSQLHQLTRRKAALDSFERLLAADPALGRAFAADTLAPWGLFRLADDEIITVEPGPDDDMLRLDRVLGIAVDDASTAVASIEWLLRINSVSVIGPRCSIEFEPESELALIGCTMVLNGLDASDIRSALEELDARGRDIEATWQRMQPDHTSSAMPQAGWLRP